MAIRDIVIGADNSVLRTETARITSFDKELKKLVQDLHDTVHHANGAGLAAPQIGESKCVTVARVGGGFIPLINPDIIWSADTITQGEEGCLSLPDIWLFVPRPTDVIIRFLDESGKEHERKLSGWDARVVQHEIDHLHGRLIVDYHAKGTKEPGEAL